MSTSLHHKKSLYIGIIDFVIKVLTPYNDYYVLGNWVKNHSQGLLLTVKFHIVQYANMPRQNATQQPRKMQ